MQRALRDILIGALILSALGYAIYVGYAPYREQQRQVEALEAVRKAYIKQLMARCNDGHGDPRACAEIMRLMSGEE